MNKKYNILNFKIYRIIIYIYIFIFVLSHLIFYIFNFLNSNFCSLKNYSMFECPSSIWGIFDVISIIWLYLVHYPYAYWISSSKILYSFIWHIFLITVIIFIINFLLKIIKNKKNKYKKK